MIGLLIMSHGELAKGTLDSLNLFMGGEVPQVEALCLGYSDSAEEFETKIKEAIERIDDGSGVVGLCDLAGGTPGNICARLISDRFHVVLGYNMGLVLELAGKRFSVDDVSELDLPETLDIIKERIVYLNQLFAEDE